MTWSKLKNALWTWIFSTTFHSLIATGRREFAGEGVGCH